MKFMSNLFNLGKGIERIFFIIIMSVLVTHVFACLWIFLSQMGGPDNQSWMDDDLKAQPTSEQYATAFYFTITTFSTVGYGDISATNNVERLFCIFIMCLGVTAFAAGTGEFTNMLQTYDQENARLQEQFHLLNRLYKDYGLPLSVYENVKQTIR